MEAKKLDPGTILAGKYRLESILGEGGMGTVYRAEHLALRAPVAVKVIDRDIAEGDIAHARFMREAQSAASLRSPHVVQILDYGMEGERPFMVMELLEGETLAARLERLHRLSPAETYRVVSHVARAIAKAHEAGIIHRDLKPDNVFLVENEGDEIAKVLDFGVAKVDQTAIGGTHTRTGSLLGTPYYMSPEQAQGNKELDSRSDLWAIGVIAFECLLGERPFSSDGLGDLVIQICIRDIVVPSSVGSVPPGFDEWFKRAVAREPELRFQTARELSESLREALGLARDPLASAPESLWSVGPRLLEQQRIRAASSPALGSGPSNEAPPPPGFGQTRDESPNAAQLSNWGAPEAPPARPKMLSETQTDSGRGSSWQVIPHQEPEAALPNKPPSILPPRVRGRTTAIIIVAALALGALIVLGLEDAGISLIPGTARVTAKLKGKKAKPPSEIVEPKKPVVSASGAKSPSKHKPELQPSATASTIAPRPPEKSVAPASASAAPSSSVETIQPPPTDPSPLVPLELEPTPAPPAPVATPTTPAVTPQPSDP
jgi:serine/threonine-protein kinase